MSPAAIAIAAGSAVLVTFMAWFGLFYYFRYVKPESGQGGSGFRSVLKAIKSACCSG